MIRAPAELGAETAANISYSFTCGQAGMLQPENLL